jgi:hypothetical protein
MELNVFPFCRELAMERKETLLKKKKKTETLSLSLSSQPDVQHLSPPPILCRDSSITTINVTQITPSSSISLLTQIANPPKSQNFPNHNCKIFQPQMGLIHERGWLCSRSPRGSLPAKSQ